MMQMQHNAVVDVVGVWRWATGGGCIAAEMVQGRPREGCDGMADVCVGAGWWGNGGNAWFEPLQSHHINNMCVQ